MPTFENVDIEVSQTIDIDFEVYCGTCGTGLCGESDTRKSRNRGYLQVSVNACYKCISEKDEEIKNLQIEIDNLQKYISKLEDKTENI